MYTASFACVVPKNCATGVFSARDVAHGTALQSMLAVPRASLALVSCVQCALASRALQLALSSASLACVLVLASTIVSGAS